MNSKKGAEILAEKINNDRLCKSVCSDGTGVVSPMEPKRTARLEYAFSAEGLYKSLQKCISGTNWKTSVASFELNGIKKCTQLSENLLEGTYEPKTLRTFEITRPKKRECTAIGIYDRVFQRSLNDNVIYPEMAKHLIKENCACQKGKGTDYARNLLKRDLFRLNYNQRYKIDDQRFGYALCLDIRGYYPNMRHDVAIRQFEKYLDPSEFKFVKMIINHQYPGEVGFTPGSQLVQIAGISVLNDIDHYIKEQLHIKYYIRYMDDFILIHKSKEYLNRCRLIIKEKLDELGFELNESKTQLINIYRQPIPFLGFVFQIYPSGKIVMNIKATKFREQKRRLRRLAKHVRYDHISIKVFDDIANQCIRYLDKNCSSRRYPNEYKNLYLELRKDIYHG